MPYTPKTKIDNEELGAEIKKLADGRVAGFQADSAAGTVGALVSDFNALLAKLQAAGLMASS